MINEPCYRGMTVPEGVAYVEQHYNANELKDTTCFADLHEVRDANMTLPFPDDVGDGKWLDFANSVIEAFDLKYQQNAGV